jgi:hypothetical protein
MASGLFGIRLLCVEAMLENIAEWKRTGSADAVNALPASR